MSEARVVIAWLADFLIRLYRSTHAGLDSDLGLMARCVCFGCYLSFLLGVPVMLAGGNSHSQISKTHAYLDLAEYLPRTSIKINITLAI